jgi:signal transduction histidine kinase
MNAMIGSALQVFRGLDEQEPMSAVDVDGLLGTLKAEFAELGGSITVVGRAARPLAARPQALKRCLTNLLSNAIKYGDRATVKIEDGAAFVIRVADEGPGIPEADLERVFEPFFRLERSRNSETGGIGLGLGIARDIAQNHGGSLTLENRAPHGLDAILTLPRAPARGDHTS